MNTRVDPKISQSENLMKLLQSNGVSKEKLQDIKSMSVTPEAKTVNEVQYNTKLSIKLHSQSEEDEPLATAFNRIQPGWVGDNAYVFTYDNTVSTPLKKDGSEEDVTILTRLINESKYFSQDEKYPFKIKVNTDYTRIEVIPHLDSPCYVGGKEYALKVMLDPRLVKIFEPVTYVVSNMGFFDSEWMSDGRQDFINLEMQDATGRTQYVRVLVLPYRTRIEGKDYKLNLGQQGGSNRYRLLKDSPSNLIDDSKYTSFTFLGDPYDGEVLTEEQKNSLRILSEDIKDAVEPLTEERLLTNSHISGSTTISVVKDNHDYKFKILKTKVSNILYNLISNTEPGDPISNNADGNLYKYIVTTDETYREHYPEEELAFTTDASETDNELTIRMLNVTDYTNTTGPHTAINKYGDYDRFNHLMRFIREHCLRKLQKLGMSTADSSILLQSASGNHVWKTITDRFTTYHSGNPNIRQASLFIDYDLTFVAEKGNPVRNVNLLSNDTYDTTEKKQRLFEDPDYFKEILMNHIQSLNISTSPFDKETFNNQMLSNDPSITTTESASLDVNRTITSRGLQSDRVDGIIVDNHSNGIKYVKVEHDGYTDHLAFQYPKLLAYNFLPGNRIFTEVNKDDYSPQLLMNVSNEEFIRLMKKYVPDYPYQYLDIDKVRQSMHYLSPSEAENDFGIGMYFLVRENDVFCNYRDLGYSLIQLQYAK